MMTFKKSARNTSSAWQLLVLRFRLPVRANGIVFLSLCCWFTFGLLWYCRNAVRPTQFNDVILTWRKPKWHQITFFRHRHLVVCIWTLKGIQCQRLKERSHYMNLISHPSATILWFFSFHFKFEFIEIDLDRFYFRTDYTSAHKGHLFRTLEARKNYNSQRWQSEWGWSACRLYSVPPCPMNRLVIYRNVVVHWIAQNPNT